MSIFRKFASFVADTVQSFVVAGAIFAVIYLFLLQPHQVVGDSMVPNFHDGEYILTDKISYRTRMPRTGEVIVFKSPTNPEKDFIKRIIARPEDKIRIKDGKVFINGKGLNESTYIPQDFKTFAGQTIQEGVEYQVPPDSYFVLGDNRLNSSDSREWGFLKKDAIIGKSLVVYWPPNAFRFVNAVTTP